MPISYRQCEWNLYQYVASSPIRFSDPLGLEPIEIIIGPPHGTGNSVEERFAEIIRRKGGIHVEDTDDAKDQIQDKCGDDCISSLTIMGHSCSGGSEFYIGPGGGGGNTIGYEYLPWVPHDPIYGTNGPLRDPILTQPGQNFFGGLNFCKDSEGGCTITVHACRSGSHRPLMQAIHNATGCTVIGSSIPIQPDDQGTDPNGDGLCRPHPFYDPDCFKDIVVK